MILAMKRHNKITDEMDLRGISIMIPEYRYLRETFNFELGRFYPHLKKIIKRSNYLCANMRYYSKDLSFENQYLL